jgi:hypothetical protein
MDWMRERSSLMNERENTTSRKIPVAQCKDREEMDGVEDDEMNFALLIFPAIEMQRNSKSRDFLGRQSLKKPKIE